MRVRSLILLSVMILCEAQMQACSLILLSVMILCEAQMQACSLILLSVMILCEAQMRVRSLILCEAQMGACSLIIKLLLSVLASRDSGYEFLFLVANNALYLFSPAGVSVRTKPLTRVSLAHEN